MGVGAATIGALGSVLNGSSGESYSKEYGIGGSEGSSWENGENYSSNAVYGSEASAKDIMRAMEANEMENYFLEKQMAFNSQEAEKQRAYETAMSNTSYQRAVRDLQKAGLNPVLAALNMGASTPNGAVASSGLANAYKATTYADQRGSSYGYSNGGSYNKWNESSRSHSEGYSRSHNENSGGSSNKSWNYNQGTSQSKSTNNLKEALNGIGEFFNGIANGMATGGYPGDSKGTGKGWDGYDNPTVRN